MKKINKEDLEKIKQLEKEGKKKTRKFINDFKAFATKGNVIDMAIGVTVATAFTKIVNSLVNEVITPLLGLLTGKVDFSSLFISLNGIHYETLEAAKLAKAPIINYGVFISNVIDFLTVAFVLFIFIRIIAKRIKKEEPKPVTTKKCMYCFSDIDILATRCPHCTSILKEDDK